MLAASDCADSDRHSILVIRGTNPVGYPGGVEVVNMQPPAHLIREGVEALPCIGDGRQLGTSGSPSILNASPEAAVGGGLALVRTGDRIRVDLNTCQVNLLVSDAELAARREAWTAAGGVGRAALADAVAGDPPPAGRPVRRRRRLRGHGQVSARRRDARHPPRQSLGTAGLALESCMRNTVRPGGQVAKPPAWLWIAGGNPNLVTVEGLSLLLLQ